MLRASWITFHIFAVDTSMITLCLTEDKLGYTCSALSSYRPVDHFSGEKQTEHSPFGYPNQI